MIAWLKALIARWTHAPTREEFEAQMKRLDESLERNRQMQAELKTLRERLEK
jgi:regulator of replication initiation timing